VLPHTTRLHYFKTFFENHAQSPCKHYFRAAATATAPLHAWNDVYNTWHCPHCRTILLDAGPRALARADANSLSRAVAALFAGPATSLLSFASAAAVPAVALLATDVDDDAAAFCANRDLLSAAESRLCGCIHADTGAASGMRYDINAVGGQEEVRRSVVGVDGGAVRIFNEVRSRSRPASVARGLNRAVCGLDDTVRPVPLRKGIQSGGGPVACVLAV